MDTSAFGPAYGSALYLLSPVFQIKTWKRFNLRFLADFGIFCRRR